MDNPNIAYNNSPNAIPRMIFTIDVRLNWVCTVPFPAEPTQPRYTSYRWSMKLYMIRLSMRDRIIYQESFVEKSYGYTDDENSITDYNGHGTHVAGIAAGSGSKNSLYIGIAPGAKLIILKVGSTYGEITLSALLAAIDTAIEHDADVISMSLGFSSGDPDNIISLAVDKAVARAQANGRKTVKGKDL